MCSKLGVRSGLYICKLIISTSIPIDFISFLIEMAIKGVNRSLNRTNFFGFFVGDVQAHVFFHGHNKLHRIQRIKAQLLKCCRSWKLSLITFGCTFQYLENFSLDLLHEFVLTAEIVLASGNNKPWSKGCSPAKNCECFLEHVWNN